MPKYSQSNTIDSETNFLYIADPKCLDKNEYKNIQGIEDFYDNFKQILKNNNIKFDILTNTKDIWCRDYMPIQLNKNKFLSYKYEPNYLAKKVHLKTDFLKIKETLNLDVEFINSNIILDGGNVIKSKEKVILTDKIFSENSKYNKSELISELERIFEATIIIIPWDKKYDKVYGHADGMIRFIDEDKVLLSNNFKYYSKSLEKEFFNALEKHNLKYEELSFDIKNNNEELNWGYINYLQMNNIIILPEFGIKEDSIAKEIFARTFKDYKIVSINAKSLIDNGGVLNCMTWNIYK